MTFSLLSPLKWTFFFTIDDGRSNSSSERKKEKGFELREQAFGSSTLDQTYWTYWLSQFPCETWVPVILSGTGMLSSIQLSVKDLTSFIQWLMTGVALHPAHRKAPRNCTKWKPFIGRRRQDDEVNQWRGACLWQDHFPLGDSRDLLGRWPHSCWPGNSRLTSLRFHSWERLKLSKVVVSLSVVTWGLAPVASFGASCLNNRKISFDSNVKIILTVWPLVLHLFWSQWPAKWSMIAKIPCSS